MALEAQNNPFTSVLFVGAADPEALPDADPSAGSYRLVIDDTGAAWIVDETGTATAVGGSSGDVSTDAIWDAAGDLAVGTGANTGAKLAIGANRLLLKSNGTTASWAFPTFIGARAYNTAAISIANNTNNYFVTMNSEEYDTDSIHSGGAFTIPTGMDGKWRLNALGLWTANTTGIRYGAWYKNGTVGSGALTGGTELLPRVRQNHGPASGDYEPMPLDITVVLAAADVVRFTVFQNSGGALNFGDTSPYSPYAEVQFLGV